MLRSLANTSYWYDALDSGEPMADSWLGIAFGVLVVVVTVLLVWWNR